MLFSSKRGNRGKKNKTKEKDEHKYSSQSIDLPFYHETQGD